MRRESAVLVVLCLSFISVVPVWSGQISANSDKEMSRIKSKIIAYATIIETATAYAAEADNVATPVDNGDGGAEEVIQSVTSDGSAKNIDLHEVEALQAVPVENIEKIPSNFGLWWRGVRETLSLTFTWDEMSKAEKALQFAEERMRIARLIAEQQPDDAKAQEKVQKMIERAQKFIDKVEAKRDKWSKDGSQEELDRLVGNIATHQSNADVILDEIEKDFSKGDTTAIGQSREKGAEASARLLSAIANVNISAETKAHLEEVKARIEQHAAEVKAYNTERKTLQEKIGQGDESAKADLEALKDARQTQIQVRTEGVGEIKTKLEEKANTGDEAAKKKLDIINKVQGSQKQEEGVTEEDIPAQATSNDNGTAKDTEVQALSEKIKAVLEERNKISDETGAAAAIAGDKTDL
jgi:hypothetical protein